MIKKYLSLVLSVVLVTGLFAANVFADENKGQELVFKNDVAEADYDKSEDPDGFYFTLDKSAYVSIVSQNEYDVELTGDNTIMRFIIDSPEAVYLNPGKYYIKDKSPTTDHLTVSLLYFDVVLTRDGQKYDLLGTRNVFGMGAGESYSVEVSAHEGHDYKFKWACQSSVASSGIIESSKADFVFPSDVKKDELALLIINGDKQIAMPFYVWVDEHLTFDRGFINNYIVDPNGTITFTYSGKGDKYTEAGSWNDFEEEVTYNNVAVPFISRGQMFGKTNYATAMTMDYVFVKDLTSAEKIKAGDKYQTSLTDIEPDDEDSIDSFVTDKYQQIYSFTPEKTATYSFKSYGQADPYCALFDSDFKCIAYSDDPVDWWTFETLNRYFDKKYGIYTDFNFDITAELEAGKTYYFFVVNSTSVDLNISDWRVVIAPEFEVELSCDTPDPTETPTPTAKSSDPTPTSTTTPTQAPSKGGTFEDFVERLYTVALNRPSEPEGKAFWCEHVGNGDLNGAQCANEFLLSKEFNNRKLTDEQFLEVLYKTFFNREAKDDKDGFNFWMNCLKTQGRDSVVDCFINSEEWCNVCASYGVKSGATRAKATVASANATAFATRLYTECLGRDPEEGGLKFWSLGLTNLELTGKQAAHEFFFSKEFNDFNLDNQGLLTRMYKTFMGREPDTDGMNFWLDNMKNGMTKEDVFNEFVKSKEFTEICQSYAIDRG